MPNSSRHKNEGARTVVGRGKKSLLSDPGAELRPGKEKAKKWEANRWDEQKEQKKKNV